ncbi:MAG: DUF4010 domain-containing protein, partial [Candidatus Thermoplasmatota archaeon]|nr:DUF4010 domain-containing protein [Candidatus Thermoplasmatota archaeon]
MTTAEVLLGLVAAIGLGALVGIEREPRRDEQKVYAGVRTFPLICVAGYLTALLAAMLGEPLVLAGGLVGISLLALSFFVVRYLIGEVGFTTPMAIIVTFLAGTLVGYEMLLEATAVALATAFLLLTKRRLHRVAEAMDTDEMMGALQFVALAFLALPLATSLQGSYAGGLVGPGRPVDPRWTLYVVVAASALAFLSFLALRRWGSTHGFTLAGLLGGLVNSEAATARAGTLARSGKGLENAAGAAVLAATAAMLARNVVLAALAEPSLELARGLFLVVLVPAVLLAAATYTLNRRAAGTGPEAEDLHVRSPFAIRPAILFALVFTVVNAAVFYGQHLGALGIYATSLGALVSSGAVVASAANLVLTG